jgi:hypothetical protein
VMAAVADLLRSKLATVPPAFGEWFGVLCSAVGVACVAAVCFSLCELLEGWRLCLRCVGRQRYRFASAAS